jgi:hypothetical protein
MLASMDPGCSALQRSPHLRFVKSESPAASVPSIAGLRGPTRRPSLTSSGWDCPNPTPTGSSTAMVLAPLIALDRGGLGRAAMGDPIIWGLPDLSASLYRLIAPPSVEQHAQRRDEPKRLV